MNREYLDEQLEKANDYNKVVCYANNEEFLEIQLAYSPFLEPINRNVQFYKSDYGLKELCEEVEQDGWLENYDELLKATGTTNLYEAIQNDKSSEFISWEVIHNHFRDENYLVIAQDLNESVIDDFQKEKTRMQKSVDEDLVYVHCYNGHTKEWNEYEVSVQDLTDELNKYDYVGILEREATLNPEIYLYNRERER